MKSLFFTVSLVLSFNAFAKMPATEAVAQLVAPGNYVGKNGNEDCNVTVKTQADAVSVTIETKAANDSFTILNSSMHYSVNNETGEISATHSLKFPHYLNGGTKLLNIRAVSKDHVEFFISTILLDHRGNDISSYVSCKI